MHNQVLPFFMTLWKLLVKKKVSSAFIDPVKYVDANIGSNVYHVRCSDAAQAKKLSDVKSLGDAVILSGEEEQSYWDTIRKDRDKKIAGKVPKSKENKKKPRGKERLVIKLEEAKRTNHTYFGDL